MSWLDQVRSDPALSQQAKRLASIIEQKFTAYGNRADFYDSDACIQMALAPSEIREFRYELMKKNYLHPLRMGDNRPAYRLGFGQPLETV